MVLLVATNDAEAPAPQIAPPQHHVMAAVQAAVEWKHRVTTEKGNYGFTVGTTSPISSLPLHQVWKRRGGMVIRPLFPE